ncbi:MAG: hypothetical protein JWM72_4741 [Actinomycetia bacterium]|nr:hypothetical protein [Actinomycetes bacterium]
MTQPPMRLAATVISADDPRGLADFYQCLLGWIRLDRHRPSTDPRSGEFPFVYKGYSTIVEHMFVTAESIAAKRKVIDALEADWLQDLAEYARSGDWQTAGYFNVASALRHTARIDQGVAQGYVNLARKLDALPLVAAAFAAGDISLRHAQVIAKATTTKRAAAISQVEDKLVDIARQHAPRELSGVSDRSPTRSTVMVARQPTTRRTTQTRSTCRARSTEGGTSGAPATG